MERGDLSGAPRDAEAAPDLTTRRLGEEHLRFLAEAGEILAASLDYESALAQVAHLIVPAIADWCVVDLLGVDNRLHRLAVVHRDPAKAAAAEDLKRRYPILAPDQTHRIWDVLPAGPAWFDPAVSETRFVTEARDAEHLALLRRLGFTAEMVLPLVARGRALGVITLVLAEGDRHYGPGDLALAEELARRAALAIDNARLYAEAQASEARYRALFEGVADAILVLDTDGTLRDVNSAAVELLGYERDQLVGKRLDHVFAADSGQSEVGSRWPFPESPWQGELTLRCSDGATAQVETRTTVIALPTGSVTLAVMRDVSARIQAEADRQRLAALVESSDDAIIGKALDGIVTSWNPAAERMYGYSAAEMLGQSIIRIFPPEREHELWVFLERLRRGERIHPHDTDRLAKNGRRVEVSVSISPIVDAAGHPSGAATIARDISERKRLEAIQRDYLAMVAHDLRSPLTVVRGNAQLLQRRREFSAAKVESILVHSDRMARLLDDLADVVRLEEGRLPLRREEFALADLVLETVSLVQAQGTVHDVRVETLAGPIVGNWDRMRVGQVLENVLGNAIKHAPMGDICVRLGTLNGEALVSVADTGPGIAPEYLPRLFGRFFQADAAGAWGLGLGLYISRMLVEAHGGRIWVESELGQGSVFTIAMPMES